MGAAATTVVPGAAALGPGALSSAGLPAGERNFPGQGRAALLGLGPECRRVPGASLTARGGVAGPGGGGAESGRPEYPSRVRAPAAGGSGGPPACSHVSPEAGQLSSVRSGPAASRAGVRGFAACHAPALWLRCPERACEAGTGFSALCDWLAARSRLGWSHGSANSDGRSPSRSICRGTQGAPQPPSHCPLPCSPQPGLLEEGEAWREPLRCDHKAKSLGEPCPQEFSDWNINH